MTRATRLLVCLCLGVATTVAIAWASGAWARFHAWDEVARGRTIRYHQPGAECAVGGSILDPEGGAVTIHRRGWPLLALECQITVPAGVPIPEVRGGFPLRRAPSPPFGAGTANLAALPMIPVWPGFAVDAVLYAALWRLADEFARRARQRAEHWTWRAVAATCALCAGLGAGTTVLVAWGCAMLIDEDGHRVFATSGIDRGTWLVVQTRTMGATRLYSDWLREPASWQADVKPRTLVAPWGDELLPQSESGRRVLDARGWPMLAMWGSFGVELPRGAPKAVHWAVALPRQDVHGVRDDWTRVIPLAPIWLGFAVDTLFYGLAWVVLIALVVGPGALRRASRRRRGRCLRCAYDLRGIPAGACPECGATHGANST